MSWNHVSERDSDAPELHLDLKYWFAVNSEARGTDFWSFP